MWSRYREEFTITNVEDPVFLFRLIFDIAEYNANFGDKLEVTVPYIKNFNRTRYHFSNLAWGMSIRALIKLMNKKGYDFVGTNNAKCNAFFVRSDLFKSLKIDLPHIEDLSKYTNIKINEGLDQNGNLAFYDQEQKKEIMKNNHRLTIERKAEA